MSKVKALNKGVYDNAVSRKELGAPFPKQGYEVLAVAPNHGWVVKLHDHESVLLFANEVKAGAKDYPDLVRISPQGVILNDKALIARVKAKEACTFSL